MNYTLITLLVFGVLGILLHNLVEINKLNRADHVNFKLGSYFKVEWPAIMISFIVVIVALIARGEIKELEAIGNKLGLAFTAIGYMAQSLLIWTMGKAEKMIDKKDE